MIIINFKNYVSGEAALNLAKLVEKHLPSAIVCPEMMDADNIAAATKLKVFLQHVDFLECGRATGFVVPKIAKSAGIAGSLLNHSEHRIKFGEIKKTIAETNKSGLKIILCCASLGEARKFLKVKPWAIAFEDRDLIATGKSITERRSEAVKKFALLLKGSGILALCGAGVHSANDVRAARSLGCKGVLIASAVANVSLARAEKLLKEISKV